jgi:phage/plasmid-associated DNA primase
VSGNFKPGLRPDSAMRRRVKLIPMLAAIPDGEKDKQLGKKLQQEWPEIL